MISLEQTNQKRNLRREKTLQIARSDIKMAKNQVLKYKFFITCRKLEIAIKNNGNKNNNLKLSENFFESRARHSV